MRVARRPEGDVVVDDGRSRSPGRGVYLCRAPGCVEIAVKRQILRRALGVEISASVYEQLRAKAVLSRDETGAADDERA
jgi:predicted RNA-binding protein YlxR (DUF448 family)